MSQNEATAVKYHHVGTGMTTSRYYCSTCDGYYGVPHDGDVHSKRHKGSGLCACRPCQERSGQYPKGGVMMKHDDYLRSREGEGVGR